jgi:hypothetical protein
VSGVGGFREQLLACTVGNRWRVERSANVARQQKTFYFQNSRLCWRLGGGKRWSNQILNDFNPATFTRHDFLLAKRRSEINFNTRPSKKILQQYQILNITNRQAFY